MSSVKFQGHTERLFEYSELLDSISIWTYILIGGVMPHFNQEVHYEQPIEWGASLKKRCLKINGE